MSVFFVAIPGELLAQGSMQLPGAETAQPNEVRAVTLDVTYYGSRQHSIQRFSYKHGKSTHCCWIIESGAEDCAQRRFGTT
jgi:hypothetical protein